MSSGSAIKSPKDKSVYPLLLDVDNGIMDRDEDVLRVHVAHQATCCKSLQYTLYKKYKINLLCWVASFKIQGLAGGDESPRTAAQTAVCSL